MMQPFSSRTNWDLNSTGYALAYQALRASGKHFFDLTASNPTHCGFEYDRIGILRALGQPQCLEYAADPRGLPVARAAVAQYYFEAASARVSTEQIFLVASTSEAYSYLFRLHCDLDAEVLIAQPSYPLFQFLADLDNVRLVPYPLFYDHGWHIDLASLTARITARTRAIVIVHPNNPTGHFTSLTERLALERICQEHGLVLIVDEVFLDYAFDSAAGPSSPRLRHVDSFAGGNHPVLTYVLSGLSKVAGLPQMKASWIVVFGPEPFFKEANARLEVIADTFLSINTPVQHALPYLLAHRSAIQQQILARVQTNLTILDQHLASVSTISRLEIQGGWYAVLRVPALMSVESLAIRLIEQQSVLVHPGYFYGFDGDGWIVVSLLAPTPEFTEGIRRLIQITA